MTAKKLAFVSFEPKANGFSPFLAMEGFVGSGGDPEPSLAKAGVLYEEAIESMRGIVREITDLREKGELTPARKIWQLGNCIFELTKRLGGLSFEIDGLYEHLVRDLDVKRKWLEKVVIFRRYLPSVKIIPVSSCWGQFEKGTRKAAERLLDEFHKNTGK